MQSLSVQNRLCIRHGFRRKEVVLQEMRFTRTLQNIYYCTDVRLVPLFFRKGYRIVTCLCRKDKSILAMGLYQRAEHRYGSDRGS